MAIDIQKLNSCPPLNPHKLVKVTEMGNITEVQYMSKRNNQATIKMLPGGKEYIHLATGEVKEIQEHDDNRLSHKKSLMRTFSNARALINTNVTEVNNVRWITLTYAENMTDTVRLYKDFERFNKRFQYFCDKQGYGKADYIVMMEPQGRGAWHCHLLYIWDHKAPFIPNDTLRDIWQQGYVTIKKLDNVDNVGAYLTAYLGDMELNQDNLEYIEGNQIKELEIENNNGIMEKKYYIKGARLNLYPANFNMIRCSRGVKRPKVDFMTQDKAEKKIKGATLTFEKTVFLQDTDSDFESLINTKYYNSARVKNQ